MNCILQECTWPQSYSNSGKRTSPLCPLHAGWVSLGDLESDSPLSSDFTSSTCTVRPGVTSEKPLPLVAPSNCCFSSELSWWPLHRYAIADNAYRVMCSEYNNHFILISGESGAGKTEASKKILQYYAVTCPTTEQLQVVRDRLLLSNPVLEVKAQ